jgi:hypothetical protein
MEVVRYAAVNDVGLGWGVGVSVLPEAMNPLLFPSSSLSVSLFLYATCFPDFIT